MNPELSEIQEIQKFRDSDIHKIQAVGFARPTTANAPVAYLGHDNRRHRDHEGRRQRLRRRWQTAHDRIGRYANDLAHVGLEGSVAAESNLNAWYEKTKYDENEYAGIYEPIGMEEAGRLISNDGTLRRPPRKKGGTTRTDTSIPGFRVRPNPEWPQRPIA